MKNLVENLLRIVQQGDLKRLQSWIDVTFPTGSEKSQDLRWTSLYHPKSGDTVQIVAARHGHLHILQWLHDDIHVDFCQSNFGGKHPLHEAAQYSNLDCLCYLLDCGSAVDCIKQADWTPLMLACTKNNIEVVKELVGRGADLELKNKDGWTSFHIAVREGHRDIINYLLTQKHTVWNTVSKNGRTPLHTAALNGKLNATMILLELGNYAVDTKDSCGSTPLMDAVLNGHLEVAELLIQTQGASLSTENNAGRQAIHLAAQAGNQTVVSYLVCDKDININTPSTTSGVTPLHMAAKEKQAEMIQHLCKLGADVHSLDSRGRKSLHIAVGIQDLECVRVLIDYGAKDSPDKSGRFARDMAFSEELKDLLTKS